LNKNKKKGTSHPLGERDAFAAAGGASSRIRKISYSPRGTSRPLDGQAVSGPRLSPVDQAGGTIFKNFPNRQPFSNLIF
jgi:hypothetical protein